MSISRRLAALLAILLSFSLIAAACGDDDDADTDTDTEEGAEETPAEEGGDLSGDIFVTGSSTVEPISVRVQELFNDANPNVNIAVDGPGTGDGFAAFCGGEADMTGASRAIREEEAATCAENGIEFTELQVGIDGIAVMTNAENDAVECVSFADIYGLVGPESTGFSSWADANEISAELGGAGELPDAPLDIFGPGEESGTFDSFVELVLEDFAEERGQEATTRPDYSPSGDDNVILQGIEGSTTSFGWVGFAFASADELVKLLAVDDGESGCVEATPETIASGEYPIARPLFVYVDNARAADNAALAAFVDFYVTEGLDTAVSEVGYVALTDEAKAATQAAWESRGASAGGDDMGGEDEGAAGVDPNLSGEIFVTGSSTVEPISVRVQELFNEIAGGVNIAVDGPGTGDGFAAFCGGEADMTGASRAIREEEAATCAENGIEFTELQVGIDGIAVMTNAENDAVECVSFADIYGLVGPESTGFSSWADANEISAELGGAGELPDAPLDIFGPGEESGTFDSFVELVLEDFAEERGQEATTRPDYSPSGDDNVILQGIEGSTTSFGWVGFAFASADELVKLLAVDDGESGCVEATPETIASGEYPIARPLFVYVDNARAADNAALAAFVDFYVTEGLDTAVSEVGYVALTDEAKAATQAAWEGR